MKRIAFAIFLLAITSLVVVPASAVNTITFDPASLNVQQGASANITIKLDEVPSGLAGYQFDVILSNPGTARITAVTYPSWAGLSRSNGIPGEHIMMSGVDLERQVGPGAKEVILGTITVQGGKAGTSSITVSDIKMDADGGAAISPSIGQGAVVVTTSGTPITWTPAPTAVPTTAIPVTTSSGGSSVSGGSGGSGTTAVTTTIPVEGTGTGTSQAGGSTIAPTTIPTTAAAGTGAVTLVNTPVTPITQPVTGEGDAGLPWDWIIGIIVLIVVVNGIAVLILRKKKDQP